MTRFGWPTRPLGDLFSIGAGKSVTPESRRGAEKYPFLRTSNVLWGKIDLSRVDQMHFTQQELRDKSLAPGDLLVCEGGEVGRAAIWNGELATCAFQNHLHRLRLRSEEVVPGFFMYALQAGFTQLDAFEGAANRTTIPNLSRNRVAQLSVPFPSREEQERVHGVLSRAQRVVSVEEQLIAITRELKHATMHQLFTRGLRGEPQTETEIGPLPQSWQVNQLGRHVRRAQYGISMKGQRQGRYPILRMNCQLDGRVVFRNLQYVDLDDESFRDFRLARNDLLFNRTNSYELVGRMALYESDRDAAFASYLIRLTVDDETLHPAFVNYYFNLPATQDRLRALASRGVSQANINASKLKEFAVPVPPSLDEQRELVGILRTIDDKIALHERRLALLRELFDAMLHDLMTGRIRLGDLDVVDLDGSDGAAARAAHRAGMRIRLLDQRDDARNDDVAEHTPEDRLGMMWQLARDAWAFTEHPDRAESRLQRHVVRTRRRER